MKINQRGFSLIELMMALALMSILLVLGIPSFQAVVKANRLIAANNDMIGSLNLSRSYAIKENIRVTLCKSHDGVACADAGGWDQGWIVFTDQNNNAAYDVVGERVLLIQEQVGGGVAMIGDTQLEDYISYVPRGNTQLTSGAIQTGAIVTCDQGGGVGRRLRIAPTGRVQVAKETGCS